MKIEDIYVIVWFPRSRKCFTFDRGYNQMPVNDLWKQVCVGQIVEVDDGYIPPYSSDEVRELAFKEEPVTLWIEHREEE